MGRMPAPSIWGPRLWKILHSLSTRTATKTTTDAIRELKGLLQTLELIVPCVECKKHIHSYNKINKLPSSLSVASDWVCSFHNAVNERLGKPIFLEKPGNQETVNQILSDWSDYKKCIKDSVLIGHVKGVDLLAWERRLRLFLSFT
jgi:hypothetical protein